MFLRNFDNWLIAATAFPLSPAQSTNYYQDAAMYVNQPGQFTDGNVNVKMVNGSIASVNPNEYRYSLIMLGLNKYNICLGTGTTPVTYDDYDLSGDIVATSPLTYQRHEFFYNEETHKFTKRVVYLYTNSDTKDLTISEWGLWTQNGTYGSPTAFRSNTSYDVLLYREVLETPLVIPAGLTSTLTFEVEFPMMHRI